VSAQPAGAIQGILLDIEGTTTPISFVSDVLFPYARSHLRAHVEQHASSPDYELLFDRLRDEHAVDRPVGEMPPPWVDAPLAKRLASVDRYAEWLMDRDRKSTALKELQGRIWKEGYSRGDLVGVVFSDVPPALERWRTERRQVSIFSSGSVLAQQLLFRHSSAGDLAWFLTSFFDTRVGTKIDPQSYRRIADAMTVPAGKILFASDVIRELDAARTAGMQTRLVVRPGNAPSPPGHPHPVIYTFDELPGE
jgi:enolase-phosphatase E1